MVNDNVLLFKIFFKKFSNDLYLAIICNNLDISDISQPEYQEKWTFII